LGDGRWGILVVAIQASPIDGLPFDIATKLQTEVRGSGVSMPGDANHQATPLKKT